jgi:hypothetical protein
MVDFHHSSSCFLESRCSILATISLGASLWPTPAPELGTAEGFPEASSQEDQNALDPPSVNRAIQATTMAILDRPPPILPLATDITITSLSQQGLDAERGGDPPHASRGQYNIV